MTTIGAQPPQPSTGAPPQLRIDQKPLGAYNLCIASEIASSSNPLESVREQLKRSQVYAVFGGGPYTSSTISRAALDPNGRQTPRRYTSAS